MFTLLTALLAEILNWDSMVIFYVLMAETAFGALCMVIFAISEYREDKRAEESALNAAINTLRKSDRKLSRETQSYLAWKESHSR